MNRRIFRTVLGIVALAALLGVPNTAASDGLPLPSSITPKNGVQGADGTRYITRPSDGTTVVRQLGSSGSVQAATVNGQWWIPAVTAKGAPGGLSADGSTLVLVKSGSRVPHAPTRLLVLNARNLVVAQRLTLHGAFSFDAISPNGSKLYFIEYLSAHDPTRYAVRAYDRRAGQMLRDPIVDPNEHAGEMRGYPILRRTSPDGRWDYTFYGLGDKPFVHALDTSKGRAVCIDLDGLVKPANVYITRMAMSSDGQELTLLTNGKPVAVIDSDTLKARDPSVPVPPSDDGGDGFPWIAVAVAVGAALIAGSAITVMRRRHGSGVAAPEA